MEFASDRMPEPTMALNRLPMKGVSACCPASASSLFVAHTHLPVLWQVLYTIFVIAMQTPARVTACGSRISGVQRACVAGPRRGPGGADLRGATFETEGITRWRRPSGLGVRHTPASSRPDRPSVADHVSARSRGAEKRGVRAHSLSVRRPPLAARHAADADRPRRLQRVAERGVDVEGMRRAARHGCEEQHARLHPAHTANIGTAPRRGQRAAQHADAPQGGRTGIPAERGGVRLRASARGRAGRGHL